MLFYINETNLEQEKNKKLQKTTKNARIPPRGMGNGLEKDYSEKMFTINGYNIRKII